MNSSKVTTDTPLKCEFADNVLQKGTLEDALQIPHILLID